MRAVIDQQAPNLKWAEPEPSRAERGGCGEPFHMVLDSGSGIYKGGGEYADGAIDDTTWPGLLTAIQDVAKEDGFTRLIILQDKTGNHAVAIGDPRTNATVNLMTAVNTTLSLRGACFLPEAARRSPSPT
ncbi:MAG: LppA family lipoprotein [Dermatophilaceae bacterium]